MRVSMSLSRRSVERANSLVTVSAAASSAGSSRSIQIVTCVCAGHGHGRRCATPRGGAGARGVSVVIVAVIAVVLFVAGVGVGWLVFSPPAKRVSKLFLGTNTPFPPFEFYNNSLLIGFDIELIQDIVHRGWGFNECTDTVTTACYEWTDFQTFLPLLAAVGEGRIDIGVGAITENGDTGAMRNSTMDFSDPYYLSNQGVLKRAGDSTVYCAAAECTVAEMDRSDLQIEAKHVTTR